jgi:lysozyme
MKMSPQGLAALAQFEGLKTEAYRDSVGVVTIGVGHTAAAGPPKPYMGMTITHQEALDILARDLPQYEAAVEKRMPMVKQWVFDGAVSFCFNEGPGAIGRASWVAKFAEGHFTEAEASFKTWNKAGGRTLQGLITRRSREADMIFRNHYPDGRSFSLAKPQVSDQPTMPMDPPSAEPPPLIPHPPDDPGVEPPETDQPANSAGFFMAALVMGCLVVLAIAKLFHLI